MNYKSITNQNSEIIIIGSGGHAVSIANVAISAGYNIKFFLDIYSHESHLLGYKIVQNIDSYINFDNVSFAIGIGNNSIRERVFEEFSRKYKNIKFPPLMHKSSIISSFCTIDVGVIVMPQAVIGPNTKIGKFCIINTHASIDHDCIMHDFSSLAPSAVTGGRVMIGYRSAVSIGAVVKDNLFIGNDSVLGANSYLHNNLGSNQIVVGSPAKLI
jgi:sugar O-acyltransferase (sialic acid O-acetyltransferase NeuD family)